MIVSVAFSGRATSLFEGSSRQICAFLGRVWFGLVWVCTLAGCPNTVPDNPWAHVTCEEGKVASRDTQGHCCWKAQAWSSVREQCVGIPQCREGFFARRETCEPWPEAYRALHEQCSQQHLAACLELANGWRSGAWGSTDHSLALELLTDLCDTHHQPDACEELAVVLLEEGERERAVSLLEAACEHQRPAACVQLGSLLLREEGARSDKGLSWFLRGCEQGEQEGCQRAISMVADRCEQSAPESLESATDSPALCQPERLTQAAVSLLSRETPPLELVTSLLQNACEGFVERADTQEPLRTYDIHACARLSTFAVQTLAPVPASKIQVDALLSLACAPDVAPELLIERAPHAEACALLAGRYQEAEDLVRSGALWQRACLLRAPSAQARNTPACTSLVEVGTALMKTSASQKGLDLYEAACPQEFAPGCSMAGKVLLRRRGSQTRAVEMLRDGCDGGDWEGCDALGQALERGAGIRKNLLAALDLYERSCKANYTPACASAGWMYIRAQGVSRDASKAANYFETACKDTFLPGCHALGLLVRQGQGRPQNHRRSQRLFRQACDGGWLPACSEL